MENEYREFRYGEESMRRTRLHYIRYAKLRCAKCKSQVGTDALGKETRCCKSFVEAVQ